MWIKLQTGHQYTSIEPKLGLKRYLTFRRGEGVNEYQIKQSKNTALPLEIRNLLKQRDAAFKDSKSSNNPKNIRLYKKPQEPMQ